MQYIQYTLLIIGSMLRPLVSSLSILAVLNLVLPLWELKGQSLYISNTSSGGLSGNPMQYTQYTLLIMVACSGCQSYYRHSSILALLNLMLSVGEWQGQSLYMSNTVSTLYMFYIHIINHSTWVGWLNSIKLWACGSRSEKSHVSHFSRSCSLGSNEKGGKISPEIQQRLIFSVFSCHFLSVEV